MGDCHTRDSRRCEQSARRRCYYSSEKNTNIPSTIKITTKKAKAKEKANVMEQNMGEKKAKKIENSLTSAKTDGTFRINSKRAT
jgi:hypothetical protein